MIATIAGPAGSPSAFTPPAPVDAVAWADAILGPLRPVAPAHQVRLAEIVRRCPWDYGVGEVVYPIGPTLDDLRALLAEHDAGIAAESEDAGDPATWPEDADAWTWEAGPGR